MIWLKYTWWLQLGSGAPSWVVAAQGYGGVTVGYADTCGVM